MRARQAMVSGIIIVIGVLLAAGFILYAKPALQGNSPADVTGNVALAKAPPGKAISKAASIACVPLNNWSFGPLLRGTGSGPKCYCIHYTDIQKELCGEVTPDAFGGFGGSGVTAEQCSGVSSISDESQISYGDFAYGGFVVPPELPVEALSIGPEKEWHEATYASLFGFDHFTDPASSAEPSASARKDAAIEDYKNSESECDLKYIAVTTVGKVYKCSTEDSTMVGCKPEEEQSCAQMLEKIRPWLPHEDFPGPSYYDVDEGEPTIIAAPQIPLGARGEGKIDFSGSAENNGPAANLAAGSHGNSSFATTNAPAAAYFADQPICPTEALVDGSVLSLSLKIEAAGSQLRGLKIAIDQLVKKLDDIYAQLAVVNQKISDGTATAADFTQQGVLQDALKTVKEDIRAKNKVYSSMWETREKLRATKLAAAKEVAAKLGGGGRITKAVSCIPRVGAVLALAMGASKASGGTAQNFADAFADVTLAFNPLTVPWQGGQLAGDAINNAYTAYQNKAKRAQEIISADVGNAFSKEVRPQTATVCTPEGMAARTQAKESYENYIKVGKKAWADSMHGQ